MRLVRTLLVGMAAALASPAVADDALHSQQELSKVGLTRRWSAQADLNPRRDKIRHLVADEQVVFVQATSGVVTAFSADTGKKLWSLLVGLPDQDSYPITTNDDTALYATGMHLYAIDKFSGEVRWQLLLPHHPSTPVMADDYSIYAGMVDGSVYSYDLQTIHDLYVENRLPRWTDNALRWRYRTPAEVVSPPVSTGKIVAFASLSGSVYAVSAEDNKLVFEFETDAPISVPMGRSASSLFVSSDDARVFCLDQTTGTTQWTFTAGFPIHHQVRVIGSQVFITTEGGGIYAVNAVSGLRQWPQRRASEFLAASSDNLYVSDELGNILMLSREDGAVLGGIPGRQLPVRFQNERTDRLFLSTSDGLVICLHQTGRAFPLYHMNPDRRPILPDLAPDEVAPPAPGLDAETTN